MYSALRIHAKRHRPSEPGGVAASAALFGLARIGLLPGNIKKTIQTCDYTEEIIPEESQEHTLFRIEFIREEDDSHTQEVRQMGVNKWLDDAYTQLIAEKGVPETILIVTRHLEMLTQRKVKVVAKTKSA